MLSILQSYAHQLFFSFFYKKQKSAARAKKSLVNSCCCFFDTKAVTQLLLWTDAYFLFSIFRQIALYYIISFGPVWCIQYPSPISLLHATYFNLTHRNIIINLKFSLNSSSLNFPNLPILDNLLQIITKLTINLLQTYHKLKYKLTFPSH